MNHAIISALIITIMHMVTLLIFLAVLGILVFVHELGHYMTARWFKVKCQEFGFGFPPRICGWRVVNGKRKFFWGNQEIEKIESEDTVWSLNWLPIGGFVKIKGEDGTNPEPDSFASQKAWKRTIILSAGVTMNLLLAMVLMSIAFMIGTPQIVDGQGSGASVEGAHVQVIEVVADSAAAKAGIEAADIILSVDGQPVVAVEDVTKLVKDKADQPVVIHVMRGSEEKDITAVPTYSDESKTGRLGVQLISAGIVKYPWYKAIWLGITSTFTMTGQIFAGFGTLIKGIFVGLPPGMDVSGPVGIAAMTGKVAKLGFVYLLQFAALLSVNLAVINFIPFPALDGGRVLFIIIEKIRRKPVDRTVEQVVHGIGFLILIGLILLVTGRDLWKFKDVFVGLWERMF